MSVYRVRSVGGELLVFEDKLTITSKGLLGLAIKGLKGTKTIPFNAITAVQHRKATWVAKGYLQFTIPGGNESRRGFFAAVADENSFMYRSSENRLIDEIKEYVERRMRELRNPRLVSAPAAAPVPPRNVADELIRLSQLNKQGILTDDEFDKAKQRLLGG